MNAAPTRICRRGTRDADCNGHALDRERCQRCRNLWARLDEVAARRRAAA